MELKELVGTSYREGMTADEIAAAIKNLNLVDPSTLPPHVSQETFDKAASELAELKRKAKERMTAEEAEKARHQELMDKFAELSKENEKMKHEKCFLEAGYDAKTASSLANSLAEGNLDEFVKQQSSWLSAKEEDMKAKIKRELLGSTPPMGGGGQKPSSPESEAVEMARNIAKSMAGGRTAAEEIFKYYGV